MFNKEYSYFNKVTKAICLSIIFFSCGINEKESRIAAQKSIETFIDSLEEVAVKRAKFEQDSIEKSLIADSIRQAYIQDSLRNIQLYKARLWRERQRIKSDTTKK